MTKEKFTIDEINLETEKRIAKVVRQFENGEIEQEELERLVGSITLIGIQKRQELSKLNKVDFSKFLIGAEVI